MARKVGRQALPPGSGLGRESAGIREFPIPQQHHCERGLRACQFPAKRRRTGGQFQRTAAQSQGIAKLTLSLVKPPDLHEQHGCVVAARGRFREVHRPVWMLESMR